MEASFEKLFCRLTAYLDRRIENNFRKLSLTAQRSDIVKSKINISGSDFKIPRFPHKFFEAVKENPLVERKLLISKKGVHTLEQPKQENILCQICDSTLHTAKLCPEFFNLKSTANKRSVETQSEVFSEFSHALHQPPVIDASPVSDAPLSQKRAWLAESADSVSVAASAGDPALTVNTAPVTVTGTADRVYRFSWTDDCLPDPIEKSITMAILAD